MPTLVLRFPGGRYHATPNGHHVNEGLIEWPPSPWRLLRALLACGYTALRWKTVPPAGRSLLETLASVLPTYRLPPASAAHSRHYMPISSAEKTTLVFDTWAEVGDGKLTVTWECSLQQSERALLAELARHLNYLGRSESWVEAELVEDTAAAPLEGDPCYPDTPQTSNPGPGWEQIALLAPVPDYQAWRNQPQGQSTPPPQELERRPSRGKKQGAAAASNAAAYPNDLIDALHWDTARWKQHGWGQPPGSRRVFYWRRADALEVAPPQSVPQIHRPPVEGMLLALTTVSGRRGGLPTVARTLPQAELLHRAVLGHLRYVTDDPCPALSGKDQRGQPLTGHRHAHILPLDLDNDGFLDHILLYARMGLDAQAQQAIRRLRRTPTKGAEDLQVALAASGSREDLRRLDGPIGDGLRRVLGPAAAWHSITPFVPPRHLKAHGKNALAGQIQAELASRDLPPAATITVLPFTDEAARRLRHHVRVRSKKDAPLPPVDCGFALRLTFKDPIAGPLCLGYASHFGLGLFAAAPSPGA